MVGAMKAASGLELASPGLGRGNLMPHLLMLPGFTRGEATKMPYPRNCLFAPQNPTASVGVKWLHAHLSLIEHLPSHF